MWKYTGRERPDFAETPGQGQESVWDYPRPPALVASERLVEVRDGDTVIASTRGAYRVLETASPPTYYVPPDDIVPGTLVESAGQSFCEWKGVASYWALAAPPNDRPVAWSYPEPSRAFAAIRDYVAFYPGRVECYVDGERVRPQPGEFYGGWITDDVVGPFKGAPGTNW